VVIVLELQYLDDMEYFEDTPDIPLGFSETPVDAEQDMYASLEELGYIFTLASNDVHTVHVNACGKDFYTLHGIANDLYEYLGDCADTCFEMGCEDGSYIDINSADEYVDWQKFTDRYGYTLETGVQVIINVLHVVTAYIASIYDICTTDVQSTLDEWQRYLTAQMNYFLSHIQCCDCNTLQNVPCGTSIETGIYATESMMLRNTRHNKKPCVCERLENLKLGQSYVNWCQVEDFIEDYNCDTVNLKKGDYIIRDFQFGHLPNGGNKGYIPYKVEDIEYDRDDHVGGYWDARKRLHLYDGYEDFYIEVYNERFNGMFHKLIKSAVKE
jgi:DNA-binding ferritin-like protein